MLSVLYYDMKLKVIVCSSFFERHHFRSDILAGETLRSLTFCEKNVGINAREPCDCSHAFLATRSRWHEPLNLNRFGLCIQLGYGWSPL